MLCHGVIYSSFGQVPFVFRCPTASNNFFAAPISAVSSICRRGRTWKKPHGMVNTSKNHNFWEHGPSQSFNDSPCLHRVCSATSTRAVARHDSFWRHGVAVLDVSPAPPGWHCSVWRLLGTFLKLIAWKPRNMWLGSCFSWWKLFVFELQIGFRIDGIDSSKIWRNWENVMVVAGWLYSVLPDSISRCVWLKMIVPDLILSHGLQWMIWGTPMTGQASPWTTSFFPEKSTFFSPRELSL